MKKVICKNCGAVNEVSDQSLAEDDDDWLPVSFPRVSNGFCLRERSHPSSAIRYTSPALESISHIRHIWINMGLILRLRTVLCVETPVPDLQPRQ
jgi:hypothetical protein